jgi:hypothetical protein
MKRATAVAAWCVVGLFPSIAWSADVLERFAPVVGANSGGASRPALKYAVSDAERFARVIVELGGVSPANELLLRQPKLHELTGAFDTLATRVADGRRAGRRTELVVYYSGHADEAGLLIGDDRYSYRTLRDRLDAIPADVRIAVLDACSSGAFTRLKSGRPRPRSSSTNRPTCAGMRSSRGAPMPKQLRNRIEFVRRTSRTTSYRDCAVPRTCPATAR